MKDQFKHIRNQRRNFSMDDNYGISQLQRKTNSIARILGFQASYDPNEVIDYLQNIVYGRIGEELSNGTVIQEGMAEVAEQLLKVLEYLAYIEDGNDTADYGVMPDSLEVYMPAQKLAGMLTRSKAQKHLRDHFIFTAPDMGTPEAKEQARETTSRLQKAFEDRVLGPEQKSKPQLPRKSQQVVKQCKSDLPDPKVNCIKEVSDINVPDKDGYTKLMRAVDKMHVDEVKDLLRQGANVNARNRYGTTALMFAVYRHREDLVSVLLDAGADTEYRGELGYTALMDAVRNRDTSIVKLLLQAGANPNAKRVDDAIGYTETPLSLARGGYGKEIKKLLREYGAKK